MNDKFTNNVDDESIARKLDQIAEQTHANGQFAAELEERLRSAHRPQAGWLAFMTQTSPTLRWVGLMILLAVVLSWSIKTLIPAPQPAVNDTPVIPAVTTSTPSPDVLPDVSVTPNTQQGGYDFRGAKLYLAAPLPESPATAHVYLLNKQDQKATLEQARGLAQRFGIQGEVYTEPTYIFDTTNYLFSDGKQSLSVYSLRFFSYVADWSKTSYASKNTPNDHAEATIREFLQRRGFDFPYRVIASDFFDGYLVQPLAPDSIPMQYESFTPPSMVVMLDESGAVLRVDAYLMDYDPAPVGEYGIINAQEALDKLLDDSLPGGKMEFVHSAGKMPHEWVHSYPDNQPVTAYGHITIYPAAESGKPPLILMDGVPVTGNTQGLESLDHYTLIKATGQYLFENGIRKLNVESWDSNVTETAVTGTLSREGDGILITSDDGSGQQYPLIDPPADVPLDTKVPETQLAVYGVISDGKMYWTYIQYFEDNSGGGGGGGGGLGFYKLNLSGPPVPFPTVTPLQEANRDSVAYVVKEGDTLAAIAQSFGLTPEKIIEANQWLEAGVLTPGKILTIPIAVVSTQLANPAPKAETEFSPTQYVVQENDTLASIAANFGVSVDALMQANGITENQVMTGQTLTIPIALPGEYVVQEGDTLIGIARNFGTTVDELIKANGLTDEILMIGQRLLIPPSATNPPKAVIENVEDMRGYLTVTIHNQVGGISAKEYTLEVAQNSGGMSIYTLDGSNLAELEPYNGLPILVSGTLGPTGKLLMESYKIPYPDLHFQILKGTQQARQLGGQDVIVFTTEDGNSYVEFLATNSEPTGTFTDHVGEMVQQEVLIVPDETFAGMPVAHIYQSAVIQENGPELQVQGNRIHVYNDGSEPASSGVYGQPNLTISKIELVYFVSNPYYQVNDPNYNQRSNYIQPVWHFHGRFDDGTEFDMLIQALKEEFLLPELVPNAGMG